MNRTLFIILFLSLSLNACQKPKATTETTVPKTSQKDNQQQFLDVLNKHLDAVPKKDLATMKSTLTPNGNMQLILPKSEPITTNAGFMKYHKDWFAADLEWSFETKILNTEVGETIGMAIVQSIYKEPLRNGKPYFNRMIISYDLQKIDGTWYFIKDHASSVQKSTDLEN
ncbi:YybH family protein [Olleya sp. R77988]|uniref:YybH family protein n=1 Tax=Olleya sp. R77988 TaxID=3093875 RepID=UPI0037C951D4